MAVFEAQARRKAGSRSHTKLIVSGGNSPAEMWVVDESLPLLFTYDYGGPGQKEIVISKGMAVGLLPDPVYNYETGKMAGALTIAKPGAPVVGLAPYNFTRRYRDFLVGNQPAIVTREYIELPYIPNAADAADVKWGAVHGAGIKNGDCVTFSRDPQNYGKLIKWDPAQGHGVNEILGQVLGCEFDQEPMGWLKWAMWDETALHQDLGPINKKGYNAPTDEGYPFDAEINPPGVNYRDGIVDMNGYLSPYTTTPTGIPGILDGGQRQMTQQSKDFTVPAGTAANTKFVFDLGFKNVVDGTVNVYLNGAGVPVDPATYTVDLKNGQLTFTSAGNTTADTVTVQFRAHFFGTPAGWDFRGSVGGIRILLQR